MTPDRRAVLGMLASAPVVAAIPPGPIAARASVVVFDEVKVEAIGGIVMPADWAQLIDFVFNTGRLPECAEDLREVRA